MKKSPLKGSIRRLVPDEDDKKDGITFDAQGRMMYHPEFHHNHSKKISTDEKIYIAKYVDIDGSRKVGFALGRTEHTIANTRALLNRSGDLQRFKMISEDEWCELLEGVGG
ncbi:hypothetical protein [Paenibacillus sp. NRS-1760]|uniref:hypothetical protein n=1 Tax=Paenibacillus sp. NRS-1760 TaxID=3233902 RepID=UPI003D2B3E04